MQPSIKAVGLFSLFLLFPFLSNAQADCTATLCGIVTDADTQQPVPYAEIFIESIGRGEVTDEQGRFHFHDLCEGKVTVTCNHIGCAHIAKEVEIIGDAEVDFQLHDHALELGEIIVREAFVAPSPAQAQRGISGDDLAQNQTLGDALQQLSGVTTLSTGATLDKPVIRGLHSNRVILLNNGVRQEGQQWGQEHAPEIDPLSADRVTAVMGANSVRYGAEALGGVILVEPAPLRQQKGVDGSLMLGGNTNGRGGFTSGVLNGKMGGNLPLSARLQGSVKRKGSLRAPDYFLENTASAEQNFAATLGLKKRRFESEVYYNYFNTSIGIFEASHVETPEDLKAAIERGRPTEEGEFSYDLNDPKQEVSHQVFKAKTNIRTGESGKLLLQYARQYNLRKEFEEEDEDHGHEHEEGPATELQLHTHTADLAWEHKPKKNFQGSLGVQAIFQNSHTEHGELLPDYYSQTTGVFWTEHWRKRPLPIEFEWGVRYDFRHLEIKEQGGEVIDKTLKYNNLSGTFGTIYQFSKNLKALLHLGSAWRAPSPNELYSDGVHHGSASYEIGRDDLTSERAFSTNLTLDFASEHYGEEQSGFRANVSIYQNFITDFIYLQPQDEVVETELGTFPVFHYEQANASLRGLDWQLEWMPTTALIVASGGSLLRTTNRDTDEPLSFMPSDRFRHSVKYFLGKKRDGQPFVKLTMVNVLEQKHFPQGIELAPPPAGYTLFHFDAGATVPFFNNELTLGGSVRNVFNSNYRDYLNRFRYFGDDVGRDVSVWVRVKF